MHMMPATPRPAATVILLRRGGRHRQRGVEVLMVRRADDVSFMPGIWVFPGGALEPGEEPAACAARELAEEAGIQLDADVELLPWSRWITPEVVPVRFDTHFLIGLAPPHTPPRPDGLEISDSGWFRPDGVLSEAQGGGMEIVFPTRKTLESLLAFETADEVLAAARDRVVEPILPRVFGTRESHEILLPGDPGYE
jgi:8-oxo-dGTP pyrophosphatase MutT (NUDIX family)